MPPFPTYPGDMPPSLRTPDLIERSVLLLNSCVVQFFLDVFTQALSSASPGQNLGDP